VLVLNTASFEVFRSEYWKHVIKNQSGTKATHQFTYGLYDDKVGPVHPWLDTPINIASGYSSQTDYSNLEVGNPIKVNLSM
jgi:hypothetical protein